jgi:hypothetical protein
MGGKRTKTDSIEVSSQSMQGELVAIKDRLSAIETIQSISNADVVKKFVLENLKTKDAKSIMVACGEPKTKAQLQSLFHFNSVQALNHHLKPLYEADLLREKVGEDQTIVLEWSNLFRRLPKPTIKSILAEGSATRKGGK